MMKKLFMLLAVSTLYSCVSYTANLDVDTTLAKSSTIEIVDKRPIDQSKSAIMSLNITNCQYGSYQIGDEDISPAKLDILKSMLEKELSIEQKQTPIELINFTTHLNAAKQLKESVSGSHSGLIPMMIIQKDKIGCSFDDLYGGYKPSESDDLFPPLITVIDIKQNDKIYHARTVISSESKEIAKNNPNWNRVVRDSIVNTIDRLIQLLKEKELSQ